MIYLVILHDRAGCFVSNFFFYADSAAAWIRNTVLGSNSFRLFRVLQYTSIEEFRKNIDLKYVTNSFIRKYD